MRPHWLFVALLVVSGVSAAQDTNFPVGPQYLITYGNPLFLHPIETPSLSLSSAGLAGTSEVPGPVELPAFAPVDTVVYFDNLYWGEHKPDEDLARRQQPPSMTPDQTAWYTNYVASQRAAVQASSPESVETPLSATSAATSEQAPAPNVIELAGGPMPTNLPSSILDTGVTAMVDPQSLAQSRYGISLGEVAAYWKSHKRQAPRVLTNQDLHRR